MISQTVRRVKTNEVALLFKFNKLDVRWANFLHQESVYV
jgi:hypothetical protein